MKKKEIPEFCQVEYLQQCNCGKEHMILTQENDYPEYETEIYILCDCGEYLEFILPVN